MTTAELIKTLAELGYGEFLATTDRIIDHTGALPIPAQRALRPSGNSVAVTDGAVLVCVAPREDGRLRVFVQAGDGVVVDHDIASAMTRAGLVPNPAPTLEDVDAELQPKGLQVLTLTEPVWVGPWTTDDGYNERYLLIWSDIDERPALTRCQVLHCGPERWRYSAAHTKATKCRDEGHPTPEAAQAACEAAIVAAWRNR